MFPLIHHTFGAALLSHSQLTWCSPSMEDEEIMTFFFLSPSGVHRLFVLLCGKAPIPIPPLFYGEPLSSWQISLLGKCLVCTLCPDLFRFFPFCSLTLTPQSSCLGPSDTQRDPVQIHYHDLMASDSVVPRFYDEPPANHASSGHAALKFYLQIISSSVITQLFSSISKCLQNPSVWHRGVRLWGFRTQDLVPLPSW
jgi:hypothetical protein